MNPIKLAIVTALWQRHDIARVMMNHYKALLDELKPEWDIKLIAVGSEGNVSRRVAQDCGWKYLEHPNEPYWKKFNCGVRFAEDWGPDFVMATGSDEVADAKLFKAYYTAIHYDKSNYLGTLDCYLFDTVGRRLKYWEGYKSCPREGETFGPWRMIHRDLLKQLKWEIYDETAGTAGMFIDGSMELRISKCVGVKRKVFKCTEIGAIPIQLKSGVNLTGYKTLAGHEVDPVKYLSSKLLEQYPC